MATKLGISFATLFLLFSLTSLSPMAETALAQEGTQNNQELVAPAPQLLQNLLEEVTFVWVQDEAYAFIKAACAGTGLNNIQPSPDGPMVLIPNAGDLSVDGSNVAIRLAPDGEITFIPRTQGQMIRVPMALGDKVMGQEVLSLTLDEASQLMAAGKMTWTAQGFGPYGTGHGLPGHIAACDPRFDENVWDDFVEDDDEDEA